MGGWMIGLRLLLFNFLLCLPLTLARGPRHWESFSQQEQGLAASIQLVSPLVAGVRLVCLCLTLPAAISFAVCHVQVALANNMGN
jgi:hypothetical protein